MIFIFNITVKYYDWREEILSALCYRGLLVCKIHKRNFKSSQIEYLQYWVIGLFPRHGNNFVIKEFHVWSQKLTPTQILHAMLKVTEYIILKINTRFGSVLPTVFGSALPSRRLSSRTLCFSYYNTIMHDSVLFGKWLSTLRKKLLSLSSQLQYYLFKCPRINKVYVHIFQHSFINTHSKDHGVEEKKEQRFKK